MKALPVVALLVVCLGVAAFGQHTYAFYYNLLDGRDLDVNVMNTEDAIADYFISVYDPWGMLLWFEAYQLQPLMSSFHLIGDHVPADNWGVVVIESTTRLVMGLEYYYGMIGPVSLDNIYEEAPDIVPGVAYWAGAYFSIVGDAETGIILMNPWNVTSTCRLIVHMQSGEIVYEEDFVFSPYESFYIYLSDYLVKGMYSWGFADVLMTDSGIILAMDYFGRGCSGLEVDNISTFYY
jgi:hypothetical protein